MYLRKKSKTKQEKPLFLLFLLFFLLFLLLLLSEVYEGISLTWGTRYSYYIAVYLMVHGSHFDFTRHNIPIDLELRGFEVRGVSKVHLAAHLKALLYRNWMIWVKISLKKWKRKAVKLRTSWFWQCISLLVF